LDDECMNEIKIIKQYIYVFLFLTHLLGIPLEKIKILYMNYSLKKIKTTI